MSSPDLPGFLVFAGSNDRAVIALCRGFARYGVDFGLIGRGADDLLLHSSYACRFLVTRTSDTLTLSDMMRSIGEARRRYRRSRWVICPTSEYLNRHLLEIREPLQAQGVEIALCDSDLYPQVSDKALFRAYCANRGLKVPVLVGASDPRSLPLPFVAKPSSNLSPEGRILYPHIVRTDRDRQRFLDDPDGANYYIEHFVSGESWYLLYYFDRHGRSWTGAQRNLLQQGQGKSVVLARAERYPDARFAEDVAARLRADRYRGFIMVEVRLSGDGPVVIEANPRCWGPLQLTLDAHIGLFEAFLNDYGFTVDVPHSSEKRAFYLWTGGALKAIRDRIGLTLHAPWTSVASAFSRALARDVYARGDSLACYSRGFSR